MLSSSFRHPFFIAPFRFESPFLFFASSFHHLSFSSFPSTSAFFSSLFFHQPFCISSSFQILLFFFPSPVFYSLYLFSPLIYILLLFNSPSCSLFSLSLYPPLPLPLSLTKSLLSG
jgi:hypothetical protein